MRVGIDAPPRSKRRSSQAAQAARVSGSPAVAGIAVEPAEILPQGLDHEGRRRVLRLADRHGDVRQRRRAA